MKRTLMMVVSFVLIINHMGTPDNLDDDVYVYPNPDMCQPPAEGTGWASYNWDTPVTLLPQTLLPSAT